MIPFHKIYSWLFKSFNISGETILIDRLISEWYQEFMIIKRSWIFALFMLWMPIAILILSGISVFIAYTSIDIDSIKWTLMWGNILMAIILSVSSLNYINHFRAIHREPGIVQNVNNARDELAQWDKYFQSFFNWSITNQWILFFILIIEAILVILYGKQIGWHFWILATDTLVILIEIGLLRKYRKRMMDLEMDYNIVVPGKIFFVNQSGLLSVVQTIDGDKIKTVQSVFPSKIASFFNYGTVHILTEGDSQEMMGTMSMYYVTNPDNVVTCIHTLIDDYSWENTIKQSNKKNLESASVLPEETRSQLNTNNSKRHSLDTREKIRDVLR